MDFSKAVTSTPKKTPTKRNYKSIINEPAAPQAENNEKMISKNIDDTNHSSLLPIGSEKKFLSDLLKVIEFDIVKNKTEDVSFSRSSSSWSLEFQQNAERLVSELCENESDENDDNVKPLSFERVTIRDKSFAAQSTANEIYECSLEACAIARNIAKSKKVHFCFNGIENLCMKTMENIKRQDSAVTKLQSQGIPWVIKTFILASMRVTDSWKSLHELFNEKHSNYEAIESKFYDPSLRDSFVKWQTITKDMLQQIYDTSKKLDDGFQWEQLKYKKDETHLKIKNDAAFAQRQQPIVKSK